MTRVAATCKRYFLQCSLLYFSFSAREEVLSINRQHCINDHTGDGDVEPDGESPSREFFMCGKASTEREEKGDENHRQHDHGKNDVRDKQGEIDPAYRAFTVKFHFTVQDVIRQIGREKE